MLNSLRNIISHFDLLKQLAKRDIAARYRGSLIGFAWSFVNPLLMLFVYTFFFTVVFKARWGSADSSKFDFALFLFVGVIVHSFFAECFNRAPGLILANANFVKKVVFPLDILAAVVVTSAVFNSLIAVVVLLVVQVLMSGSLHLSALYFPIVMLPLVIVSLGVVWLLAALGVFFRDIGQLTPILTTALLFLSPVFFPIANMPPEFRGWMMANPLTFIIEQARAVILLGVAPDWIGFAKYLVASVVFTTISFLAFQKLRNGFADVV